MSRPTVRPGAPFSTTNALMPRCGGCADGSVLVSTRRICARRTCSRHPIRRIAPARSTRTTPAPSSSRPGRPGTRRDAPWPMPRESPRGPRTRGRFERRAADVRRVPSRAPLGSRLIMLWSGNMDRQGPRRLAWLWDAPASARRSLLAAWLGWLLDGFDVMLYALVLSALIRDFSLSKTTAGLLGSLTLVASGLGGVVFGMIADRYGRKPALSGSLLVYSIFTFACGLSSTIWQLGVFRFLLGLGM